MEVPGQYLTLRIEEGENTEFVEKCRLLGNCSLNMMFERECLIYGCFPEDAWPDGEERTYLMWDCIEVPGLYLSLRMKDGGR